MNQGCTFTAEVLNQPVSDLEAASSYEEDARRVSEPTGQNVSLLLTCLDVTSLESDDTEERVRQLCVSVLELSDTGGPSPAAVCVYPVFVPIVKEVLCHSGIAVSTVAAGFPHGLTSLSMRIAEVRDAVRLEVDEVEVVIRRSHALTGDWAALYDEIRAFREAAEDRVLKVILATGELGSAETVYRSALTALMAGADFVKTSTGKERVNATLSAGFAITRAIATYHSMTGIEAGIKPAGGIRTAAQGSRWLSLVENELGSEWLCPERFRIGSSALLSDLRSLLTST